MKILNVTGNITSIIASLEQEPTLPWYLTRTAYLIYLILGLVIVCVGCLNCLLCLGKHI